MGKTIRYPVEFRREAVELFRSSGRSTIQVARSLGVSDSTLRKWIRAEREAEVRANDPDALSESEQAELRRLRKQTAQQAIDLEILRKAAAYFARETTR